MGIALGVLTFIILTIVVVVRRPKRFDPVQNQAACQAEYNNAEHDLVAARSLLDRSHELSWITMCRWLAREGYNPALRYLAHVPEDELVASDMFTTAKRKLEEMHAKAWDNLQMANMLLANEDEE